MARSSAPLRHHVAERDVLRQALAALKALGVPCERRNVGVMFAAQRGKTRLVRFGVAGEADITATIPTDGRRLEIEVKRPGQTPSPAQLEFLRSVNRSGGVGFWINDVRQLARVIPKLLAGGWVDEDETGHFFVTDEPRGHPSRR